MLAPWALVRAWGFKLGRVSAGTLLSGEVVLAGPGIDVPGTVVVAGAGEGESVAGGVYGMVVVAEGAIIVLGVQVEHPELGAYDGVGEENNPNVGTR